MRPCRIAGVLVLFSATASIGQTSACLSYEPALAEVAGTLARKTVPGPPNYESVRNGDTPETYWFVELFRPICVDEDKTEPNLNLAHKDVRRIQLVLDPHGYEAYRGLVGKRVFASGTLFGAITGHHHTPVLLTVRTLSEFER